MAQTVTYTEIEDRILQRADATSSAPGFTTEAERAYLINSLYKRLYNKLVDARGNEYYAVNNTLSTVAGQNEYPLDGIRGSLPSTLDTPGVATIARPFFELVSIQMQYGSMVRPMKTWEHVELDYLRTLDATGARPWSMVRYRVMDTSLVLRPAPAAVYTLHIYYVPIAPTLGPVAFVPEQIQIEEGPDSPTFTGPGAYISSTLDGVNGFEDWIVLSGAIAIREKKEHDVSALMAERAMLDDEINRIRSERNAGAAPRIVSRGNPWSLNSVRYPYGLADPDDY